MKEDEDEPIYCHFNVFLTLASPFAMFNMDVH